MSAGLDRIDFCICGKHMAEEINDGTCLWCGHGDVRIIREFAYQRNMEVAPVRAPEPVTAISAAPSHEWDEDACAHAALMEEARTGHFPSSRQWQRPKATGEHRPSYGTIVNRFGSWSAFKRYCADIPRAKVAA